MKYKFSICIKIIIFFVVTISILLSIRLLITTNYLKQHLIKEKYTITKNNFNKLKQVLETPLWEINNNEVIRLIKEELNDEDIMYVKVEYAEIDDIPRTIIEKVRIENRILIDYDKQQHESYIKKNLLYAYTGIVVHRSEKIGTLTVKITSNNINKATSELFLKTLYETIITALIMLFVILLGIRHIILNPIMSLNKTVKFFTEKDFSVRSAIKSNDEIGYLSSTFNSMANALDEHNRKLLRQIYYDTLTGLPNRLKLIEDLKKTDTGIVMLINIDSFQEVNDFYGYEVGDNILIELSERLKEVKSDLFANIYRLQSDEFAVVIMENIKSSGLFDEIRSIVGSFVFSIINDKVFVCNECEISIRATVGIAKINENDNIKALYNADMSLKKAKQLQKHYLVYDETLEIAKEYESNIKWTYILKEAITDDRIIPFFQPIINNSTGLIEKYECLCRLINKNNDIISPYYFLDVAKKTRLYPFITKRIIHKAFEKFESLPYEFSINVSVVDILNDDTRRYIKSIIMNNLSTAKRTVFEILESEGLHNFPVIKSFIDDVKSMGCKIAIDDFGSGYSNFDHIMSLEVDYLKIDASMIKNIDKERQSQIITKTIVNFSKELNIRTISEYVHSLSVFNKVKELGVDFSQGYFFGEPTLDITELK